MAARHFRTIQIVTETLQWRHEFIVRIMDAINHKTTSLINVFIYKFFPNEKVIISHDTESNIEVCLTLFNSISL